MCAHDALLVLISDMSGWDARSLTLLKRHSVHNDALVALVYDPLEAEFADTRSLVVSDGRLQIEVSAARNDLRTRFNQAYATAFEGLRSSLGRYEIPVLQLNTIEPVSRQIRRALGGQTVARRPGPGSSSLDRWLNPCTSEFGNRMLKGFQEISLPEPVSWWPQTAGWWVVGALLLIGLCWWGGRRFLRWRADAYRRRRIADLESLLVRAGGDLQAVLVHLPPLLKATALQAYRRSDVAALTGEAWLAFLDAQYPGPRFLSQTGSRLVSIAYQPGAAAQMDDTEARKLIEMSKRWIRSHRREESTA